jgi:SMC interacting uncharacterized protein involved in chromosome segregation
MEPPRKSGLTKTGPRPSSMHNRTSLESKVFSEKSFQHNCQKDIIAYFQEKCPETPITIKHLQTPNTKDFILVFTTLVRKIDPFFEINGKIEDEIPAFFKQLGYPITISKNSLLAVGAPNSWPSLLLSLHWLQDFVRMDEYSIENEAQVILTKDNTEEELCTGQLLKAYELFLVNQDYSDDINELRFLLHSKFQENHTRYMQMIEIVDLLRKDRDDLKHNWININNLDSKIEMTVSQTNSMKNMNVLLGNLHELEDKKTFLLKNYHEKNELFDNIQSKTREIWDRVKNQEYSLEDIKRMQQELDNLDTSYYSLEEQKEKHREYNWKHQEKLELLITETQEILNKYQNFSINNPFIKNKVLVLFHPENLRQEDISQVIVPYNFLESLRNYQQPSLSMQNENINQLEEDIYNTSLKNNQAQIELSDYTGIILDLNRKLNELKNKLKTDPEYTNNHIDLRNKELRLLENEVKDMKNTSNDMKREIKTITEAYEMRKRELSKAEIDWNNTLKTMKEELLEAFTYGNLLHKRLVQHIEVCSEFLQKQWSSMSGLLVSNKFSDL